MSFRSNSKLIFKMYFIMTIIFIEIILLQVMRSCFFYSLWISYISVSFPFFAAWFHKLLTLLPLAYFFSFFCILINYSCSQQTTSNSVDWNDKLVQNKTKPKWGGFWQIKIEVMKRTVNFNFCLWVMKQAKDWSEK